MIWRSSAHHLLRLRELDGLSALHVVVFLVALKLARADAHERDAVAVRLVHVRLNLEDERRKIGAERVNLAAVCHTRRGLGVMRRNSSKNGSTPKFVSAEPKNTGESSPRCTSAISNSRPAAK